MRLLATEIWLPNELLENMMTGSSLLYSLRSKFETDEYVVPHPSKCILPSKALVTDPPKAYPT